MFNAWGLLVLTLQPYPVNVLLTNYGVSIMKMPTWLKWLNDPVLVWSIPMAVCGLILIISMSQVAPNVITTPIKIIGYLVIFMAAYITKIRSSQ